MTEFQKEYERRCKLDREVTKQMVADGELTENV